MKVMPRHKFTQIVIVFRLCTQVVCLSMMLRMSFDYDAAFSLILNRRPQVDFERYKATEGREWDEKSGQEVLAILRHSNARLIKALRKLASTGQSSGGVPPPPSTSASSSSGGGPPLPATTVPMRAGAPPTPSGPVVDAVRKQKNKV